MENKIVKQIKGFFQHVQGSPIKNIVGEILAHASVLYEKKISKNIIDLYIETLYGYNEQDIRRGFLSHLADPQRSQFFPKPGDIVYQIQEKRRRNIA
jgi:hypothetical protein